MVSPAAINAVLIWITEFGTECEWPIGDSGARPRTKVRSLMRLDAHFRSAIACGITRKGPWRSSKTPGIQQALPNDYLKYQGLMALRDGWIKLHHAK